MSRRNITIIIFVLSLIVIGGCASIFKGTSQNVTVHSTPDKASVVIQTVAGVEVYSGTTPATTKISRKKEYIVTVKLDGYKPATVQISHEIEPWFWGNLICGGIIGIIVDASDGAMWKLDPDFINISLTTASNGSFDTRHYAVFQRLDKDGQHRQLSVPLVKDINYSSH